MSAPAIAVPDSVQRRTERQSTTQIQQHEDIARLAYALWQRRGCPEGSSEQDWLEAEHKVRNEQPSTLAGR